MLSRFVFVVFAGLCSAPVAVAQQFDRRSRDEPEVIVEAGGRVGPCDVLRFSQDGRFLIAGGDDKVARVWAHSASGLETDPEKTQILRWRAWREQRGGIKTLAVSADGKQVAVAGYGMKPSTVALVDRDTGETVAISWPRPRKGDANFGTVMMVTMDANGRVAFGTSDGSIWLWNPAKLKEPDKDGRTAAPPVRIAKHEPMEDNDGTSQFNHPRLLHFRDANTLLSLSQSGQVLECDCTQKVADTPAKAPPA